MRRARLAIAAVGVLVGIAGIRMDAALSAQVRLFGNQPGRTFV